MNETVAFYQQQSEQSRSTCEAIARFQAAGAADLAAHGFPTRQMEDWKYTVPDVFLKQHLAVATPVVRDESPLPAGVRILSLEAALRDQILCELAPSFQHGLHALNAACLSVGRVILIDAGVTLTMPLHLLMHEANALQISCSHDWIFVGEGAQVTLLETYTGALGAVYATNHLTEIFLAEKAQVSHVVIQRESVLAAHFSHVFAYQAAESVFHSHVVNLGGAWVRSDKSIYLQGEGARCLLNGVYGLQGTQHMDHHTAVFHEVPHCESEQDYKGLVAGKARAVFNGRIVVAKHAQKTQAAQQNRHLLLSKDAEVDTKPQLEIDANDVRCSHGATVGQLDENALFYFESRGVSRNEATRLMVAGFCAANVDRIGLPALSAELLQALQTVVDEVADVV